MQPQSQHFFKVGENLRLYLPWVFVCGDIFICCNILLIKVAIKQAIQRYLKLFLLQTHLRHPKKLLPVLLSPVYRIPTVSRQGS